MDIIVTTPKKEMANAAKEAEDAQRGSAGHYFRLFTVVPKKLNVDDRVWYTEDGFVRGFCLVSEIKLNHTVQMCETTGRVHEIPRGCMVRMRADSWKWVKPRAFRGFQGWRYFDANKEGGFEIMGGWRDPRPEVHRHTRHISGYCSTCGEPNP